MSEAYILTDGKTYPAKYVIDNSGVFQSAYYVIDGPEIKEEPETLREIGEQYLSEIDSDGKKEHFLNMLSKYDEIREMNGALPEEECEAPICRHCGEDPTTMPDPSEAVPFAPKKSKRPSERIKELFRKGTSEGIYEGLNKWERLSEIFVLYLDELHEEGKI